MCGIFGIVNDDNYKSNKENLIKNRGPDNTISLSKFDKYYFTFHRLCINDLSENGNQPFEDDEAIVMCNGEIYNYKHLIQTFKLECSSNSDCEVILQLYKIMNVNDFVKLLDGVFAISIYDKKKEILYLIRDRIGVRPLFWSDVREDNEIKSISFASEGKCLDNPRQLRAGSILLYDTTDNNIIISPYYNLPHPKSVINYSEDIAQNHIYKLLEESVKKRLISDRPIGCLLSGGLDSSLVASILQKNTKESIKTFSVGFKDSVDLKCARRVADYLKTEHYELILDYDDAISRIPEIIECLEKVTY